MIFKNLAAGFPKFGAMIFQATQYFKIVRNIVAAKTCCIGTACDLLLGRPFEELGHRLRPWPELRSD